MENILENRIYNTQLVFKLVAGVDNIPNYFYFSLFTF